MRRPLSVGALAAMRIRDYLNRRIIPAFVVMLASFISFGAAGFVISAFPGLPFLPIVPFIGLGACILYLHYGVRCPKCRNRLAGLVYLPRGGYFRLSHALRFCPFCGVSLDAEINDG